MNLLIDFGLKLKMKIKPCGEIKINSYSDLESYNGLPKASVDFGSVKL